MKRGASVRAGAALAAGALGLGLTLGALGVGGEHGPFARTAYAQPALPPSASAVQGNPSLPRDEIVARVGDETVTLGELDRRIRQTPAFALQKYGKTPEEIRRNFLEKVVVREIVLTKAAIDQGFDKRIEVAEKERGILRGAIVESIKKDVQSTPITDAEIRDYYAANRDKFEAPHRLSLWRILVGTEADAHSIISEMKADKELDPKKWSQLARDKSLDKSSAMRSGNLGFLNPDGSTGQPDLQYETSLFEAADKVKDGELVPEPVKEGDKWAVVWRKQGMRAVSRSVESESATIKAAIVDSRIKSAIDDLLAKLRTANVSELHPELCDMITVTETGDVERMKRPGVLPKPRSIVSEPTETPAGLR